MLKMALSTFTLLTLFAPSLWAVSPPQCQQEGLDCRETASSSILKAEEAPFFAENGALMDSDCPAGHFYGVLKDGLDQKTLDRLSDATDIISSLEINVVTIAASNLIILASHSPSVLSTLHTHMIPDENITCEPLDETWVSILKTPQSFKHMTPPKFESLQRLEIDIMETHGSESIHVPFYKKWEELRLAKKQFEKKNNRPMNNHELEQAMINVIKENKE